jgi:hypothetical protein
MPYIGTSLAKVLYGVRRSGKSDIMRTIQGELMKRAIPPESIVSYDLDSMHYDNIISADTLYEELKNRLSAQKGKVYLFLYEIGRVRAWGQAINAVAADFNVDIYISCSSVLPPETADYLSEQYVTFRIFPLSFAEYLDYRHTQMMDDTEADNINDYAEFFDLILNDEFRRYVRFGGFPPTHKYDYTMDEAYTIIGDIFNRIAFADIIRNNQVRKIDQLERIIKYVFENIGKTFSATAIAKHLKGENKRIDNETVYEYISKLENAFILHRCSRYDIHEKEVLKTQEKFYLSDISMRHSALGFADSDENRLSIVENIVYLELVRRGYDVYIGKLGNAEIDFVAMKGLGGDRLYVQMAKNDARTEYKRLSKVYDNYPKYVLRLDRCKEEDYNGIKTVYVGDFLLRDK